MGYTHYFNTKSEIPLSEWLEVVSKFTVIDVYAKSVGIDIQVEYDEDMPPLADDEVICFNGKEDLGCETFLLGRLPDLDFNFCKTNCNPYDLVVCLTLLAAYSVVVDKLEISSDGDWEQDWKEAKEVYLELFGEEPVKPPKI